MSITLAKADTALIRKSLGNFSAGRVYSENRSYGRRVKFWCTNMPVSQAEATLLLKNAFGDRFIAVDKCSGHVAQFEVKLKTYSKV